MPSPSILIVEDELIAAEDLRVTLEEHGYTICGIARSGETALDLLEGTVPDLVLMDIHLAGTMDGIETAMRIRSRFGIPVVYLTAFADDDSLERAKVTEPYGYILKPFYDRELRSVIEMALYKHRMEVAERQHAQTIRVLANAIPDPVALLDSNRKVIALNNAMLLRLGIDPLPDPESVAARVDRCNGLLTLQAPVDEAIRTGHAVYFEEEVRDAWFDVAVRPVPGAAPDDRWALVHCHDITDRKRFEEQAKREGIVRIEHNMEQFQILNDQIRNPLQAILGYVDLDCHRFQDRIVDQVRVIDKLVRQLDQGWVESEKVRQFLVRHYHNTATSENPAPPRRERGDGS